MRTVQVIRNDTGEIITSITEYSDGIKGITQDGFKVIADGEELCNEKNRPSDTDRR